MKLPILYKKTSTGKIQTWEVWTVDNTMYSQSGQLEGKKILSTDIILEGKNIGKANETTPTQQAELEARARWEGKKKKKYVESLADARGGLVSELVEGGFDPTLAKVYEKDKKHIIFPCAAQPKLDGIRSCRDQKAQWSRTRKAQVSVPHISEYAEKLGIDNLFPRLDGELYNHRYKEDFEKITHIVNQKKTPSKDHKIVEYHIYDIPSDKPFKERMKDLEQLRRHLYGVRCPHPFRVVETVICENEEELMDYREKCLEAGYEGAMVRNLDAPYEYKRSKHLQKLKVMEDAEFEIVGVEEGRGKLAGHAGSFICVTDSHPDHSHFNAKLKGKLSDLKRYWDNQEEYIGKKLTVQFQGYTNKNGVPRFPVGLRIRDED